MIYYDKLAATVILFTYLVIYLLDCFFIYYNTEQQHTHHTIVAQINKNRSSINHDIITHISYTGNGSCHHVHNSGFEPGITINKNKSR